MEYLLGLGTGASGLSMGERELESANRRLSGYRDALEKAGIPIQQELIASGDYTTETAFYATAAISFGKQANRDICFQQIKWPWVYISC